jgi:hypothetical protein
MGVFPLARGQPLGKKTFCRTSNQNTVVRRTHYVFGETRIVCTADMGSERSSYFLQERARPGFSGGLISRHSVRESVLVYQKRGIRRAAIGGVTGP